MNDRIIPNDLGTMPRVPFPLDDTTGRVALVGCGKEKRSPLAGLVPAEELYTGAYFREVLAACKAQYEWVFILSAKHGLIALDTRIEAYNVMLPWSDRRQWQADIIERFRSKCDAPPGWWALGHKIDIHAGRSYARWFPLQNHPAATIRWADWGPIGKRRQKYRSLV